MASKGGKWGFIPNESFHEARERWGPGRRIDPSGWCGEQPHGPGLGDPPALPLPGPEK